MPAAPVAASRTSTPSTGEPASPAAAADAPCARSFWGNARPCFAHRAKSDMSLDSSGLSDNVAWAFLFFHERERSSLLLGIKPGALWTTPRENRKFQAGKRLRRIDLEGFLSVGVGADPPRCRVGRQGRGSSPSRGSMKRPSRPRSRAHPPVFHNGGYHATTDAEDPPAGGVFAPRQFGRTRSSSSFTCPSKSGCSTRRASTILTACITVV